MAQQLAFPFPEGVARGDDDFFVAAPNAQAYAMLQAPDTWPDRKLVLTGPEGCGKTHLARIFARRSGAVVVDAARLGSGFRSDAQAVVVEDMDTLPADGEEPMFHLHNYLRNTGGALLMTARRAPARWPVALPDLASRMQATAIAQIAGPDDALLQALVMKLFADRQIAPKPNLVTYLAMRIERSYAAAADIVDRLDRTALAEGHKINRQLAKRLLDNQG